MLDENGNEIVEGSGDQNQGDPPATAPVVPPVVPTEPKPEGDGVQKRIDELTAKRREAERDAAYWRGQAEARTASVAQKESPRDGGGQDLDPNDFNSDADYLKAVATRMKDEIRTVAAVEEKKRTTAAGQAVIAKQYQDARTKHADFDNIALNPAVQVTQSMFDAAMGDSLGDVLYHLGKNPAEADRIATLSSVQQVKEIGKIEARLTTTTTPQPTNTPNPPSTLGGGGSPLQAKKEGEMNRAELHAKWEAERLKEAGV